VKLVTIDDPLFGVMGQGSSRSISAMAGLFEPITSRRAEPGTMARAASVQGPRRHPGHFGVSLGFTLTYLSLIVLIR
jgi:hypothetical protein